MFDAPERLPDCLSESPDQFEALRPTLGDTILASRFEVLSGHYRYADCLADETCHLHHSLPRAFLEAWGEASFLMTEGDETRALLAIDTLARLERLFAAEKAEIQAETAARIHDLEFIYDSVSVDGTEIMARGLFDPDAKNRHMKKVMESLFEQGVCFSVSKASFLTGTPGLAGSLFGGACSGKTAVEAIFSFLERQEIPRAKDQARSPTILQAKLYFKALVQAYGDVELAQLEALHVRARTDLRLARALVARGLDSFFPDYDAGPLKNALWTDALENFGLVMPTLYLTEQSKSSADTLARSLCDDPAIGMLTVEPWLKTGDFKTKSPNTARFDNVFGSEFTVTEWAIHVGRPLEARALSAPALEDLHRYLDRATLTTLLEDQIYDRTPFALVSSVDDSGASFGLSETVEITISRRDAEAIIAFTLDPTAFDYGTLIVRPALNPVTASPDAEYSYVSSAPVSHYFCF